MKEYQDPRGLLAQTKGGEQGHVVSANALCFALCRQIGKEYPPTYASDLTDFRSGLSRVFVQDSGVF